MTLYEFKGDVPPEGGGRYAQIVRVIPARVQEIVVFDGSIVRHRMSKEVTVQFSRGNCETYSGWWFGRNYRPAKGW